MHMLEIMGINTPLIDAYSNGCVVLLIGIGFRFQIKNQHLFVGFLFFLSICILLISSIKTRPVTADAFLGARFEPVVSPTHLSPRSRRLHSKQLLSLLYQENPCIISSIKKGHLLFKIHHLV